MRFVTADVTIAGRVVHYAAHTISQLLTAIPADHAPIQPEAIHVESRRPTIAELQQLWTCEHRTWSAQRMMFRKVAESFTQQANPR
jgi:hypothetical protein